MTIKITELNQNQIFTNGKYSDNWGNSREFDSFLVKNTKNKTMYITVLKNQMKMSTIAKRMNFDNGNVSISFGKKKIIVGKYIII